MGLLKNILIVGLIGVLAFVIINHFFMRTNIIWDNMSRGLTTSGQPSITVTENNTYTNQENIPLPPNSTSSGYSGVTKYVFAQRSGGSGMIIPNSAFPTTLTSNFMFSIWFFIDDYNQNLAENKYIATLIGTDTSSFAPTLFTFLTPSSNNLGIAILTQTSTSATGILNFYYVENIPIQKWNCLIISVVDRTMDIYLEGKLINSFILAGFYVSKPNTSLYVGNNGNHYFNGFITRARYSNGGVNPNEAYSIYKEGINTSFSGNFINRYRLKVGLYEYNNQVGGFTI